MIEGGCLCGGVRFRVKGKLGPAAYCHCQQCRRASGSAFAANAPARTSPNPTFLRSIADYKLKVAPTVCEKELSTSTRIPRSHNREIK